MNGNVLRIAPLLNIDRGTADQAMDIIRESVKDTMEGKVPDKLVSYFHGW
jgi:acetylornithine/succinyldiaminopimelate/putrescine aminotransferase